MSNSELPRKGSHSVNHTEPTDMKLAVNHRWLMLLAVIVSAGLVVLGCARTETESARKSHGEHDDQVPKNTHEEHAAREHEHAHSSQHSDASSLIVATRPTQRNPVNRLR